MADLPKNDPSGGAGTALLAFMLGAIAGAAVALLYAPAPGRETREFIGEKAKEAARKAAEAARKGRDVMKDVYEDATGEAIGEDA
jgi:gas vesicle protein